SGGSKEQRFAMWERLFSIISSPDGENIKLLIQGGDQVYHDDIEKTCLSLLSSETIDEDAITAEVVRIYQHFYGPSHYRKILARIPSVAMLDDHDITDGW